MKVTYESFQKSAPVAKMINAMTSTPPTTPPTMPPTLLFLPAHIHVCTLNTRQVG